MLLLIFFLIGLDKTKMGAGNCPISRLLIRAFSSSVLVWDRLFIFDVIEAQFWPIVIATVVSTVLVLVVTGWVHQLVRKSNGIFRK